jgi:hypothetical protein
MLTTKLTVSAVLVAALTLAGITSVGVPSASAATNPTIVQTTINNIVYTVNTRSPGLGATVSGYTAYFGNPKVAVVSSRVTIKGVSYAVTSIGKKAFFQSNFTGFSLPNTITSIGAYAFANYYLAGGMVIPDSVTDIAEYAFYQTSFNGQLTLGNGVKTIGRYAFSNATVGSLTIPNSVTTIGEGAFFDSNVTSLTLGSSVTTIGERAFMYTNVPTLVIPNSVTSIGDRAFESAGVTTLTLGSGLQTIESSAFAYNNGLASVVIPDSVTTIGEYAFYNNALANLTLGRSVQTIGNGAFRNNVLTAVTIPDQVTVIGNAAFQNNRLASLTLGSAVETIGVQAFAENGAFTGNLIIPASVSTIGAGAFRGGGTFDQVVLPDGLTEIADELFRETRVKSVVIPDTVTEIGYAAFAVSNLESLTLPSSVVTIGEGAFAVSNVESLTIPDSVTSIGDSAFISGQLTSLTIGDSVTVIGDEAFRNNIIEALTIGDSVEIIGSSAFFDNRFSRLDIPNSVKQIGNEAFSSPHLTEVIMSRNIVSIGGAAFEPIGTTPDRLNVYMTGTTPPSTVSGAATEMASFMTPPGSPSSTVYYPPANPDLYGANWEMYPSSFAVGVLFDANGYGTNPAPQLTPGSSTMTASAPSDPSAGVATFQGWFTERVGGTKFNFANPVTGIVRLYAQWGASFENTATPTIQGVAKVGETLVAHAGTWSPEPTLSYEWRRSGSTSIISTDSTYVVTPEDFGLTLNVTVKARADGYQTREVTSASTAAVLPAAFTVAPTPTIVGTPAVGRLLRASAGDWVEPAAFTYTWKSISTTNVTTTVGTGDTYTVAPADLGKKITLTVTAALAGYVTTSKVSALTATVATGTFTSAPAPTISGTAVFGQTLTAVTGTWSSSPTITYQWRRSGSTTVIGTAARYTLGAADIGKTLTVTVTATKTGFLTTSKSSVATATVALATFATAPTPTITGAAVFGETLRAVTGTWSNAPGFTYQWKRSGLTTAIGTAAAYTLTAADIGKTITVTVTATKSGFTTLSKTSLATAAVASATFTTAPNPTISGTATVGQPLTAVTTGWVPNVGVSYAYEWKRSDTAGGVGTTVGSLDKYTLAPGDRGKFITVTVTATKTGYITTSRTSLPTSAVG